MVRRRDSEDAPRRRGRPPGRKDTVPRKPRGVAKTPLGRSRPVQVPTSATEPLASSQRRLRRVGGLHVSRGRVLVLDSSDGEDVEPGPSRGIAPSIEAMYRSLFNDEAFEATSLSITMTSNGRDCPASKRGW